MSINAYRSGDPRAPAFFDGVPVRVAGAEVTAETASIVRMEHDGELQVALTLVLRDDQARTAVTALLGTRNARDLTGVPLVADNVRRRFDLDA